MIKIDALRLELALKKNTTSSGFGGRIRDTHNITMISMTDKTFRGTVCDHLPYAVNN